jgi:hypothetical protein
MHFQCFLTKGLGPLLLPPRFSAHCNIFHTSFTNCHPSRSNYHTSCSSWHAMTKRLQPAWAPPEIPADQPKLELFNSLTRRKSPEFFLSLIFLINCLAFNDSKICRCYFHLSPDQIFLCDFYSTVFSVSQIPVLSNSSYGTVVI